MAENEGLTPSPRLTGQIPQITEIDRCGPDSAQWEGRWCVIPGRPVPTYPCLRRIGVRPYLRFHGFASMTVRM
jgi:hypothetical protein